MKRLFWTIRATFLVCSTCCGHHTPPLLIKTMNQSISSASRKADLVLSFPVHVAFQMRKEFPCFQWIMITNHSSCSIVLRTSLGWLRRMMTLIVFDLPGFDGLCELARHLFLRSDEFLFFYRRSELVFMEGNPMFGSRFPRVVKISTRSRAPWLRSR